MNRTMRRGRPGITLVELMVVIALLVVLMLLIGTTLWTAVRVEGADHAAFDRMSAQRMLADEFRADVRGAVAASAELGDLKAGPDCLILDMAGRHVIYRWDGEQLRRIERAGEQESVRGVAIGGEWISVEFAVRDGGRVLSLRLLESRGVGPSRRNWPVEIAAALGGDRR